MSTAETSWPDRLASGHPGREAAVAELRHLLLRGLQTGLQGRAGADSAFLEDTVQNALLRILDRRHTFQGRSRFTSWALSIAFRTAFSELRRREWRAVSLEELRERQESPYEETDHAPGPDAETARRGMASLLRRVIRSDLTARQQEVLFCELNGMPQDEIVRQLGGTRNAIYKLFHDARKALKRALETRGLQAGDIRELYADRSS